MIDIEKETSAIYMSKELETGEAHYFLKLTSNNPDDYTMICYAILQAKRGEFNDWALDKDSINPDYYNWHPVECKEVTNHFNFNLGCAIKYIWRSGGPVTKGSEIEDLQKAIRYLEFEIERLKNV